MLLYNFHFNFILFVHAGHANFGFIDVQYLQNVVFSIEIGLNGPNQSLADFNHLMKKFLSWPKFPTPPTETGDFSPTPLTLFGKPWQVSPFHREG